MGRMSHADLEKFEEQILETVNDLGRDLKINIHPNRVLWYLRGVVAPSFMKGLASDQCDFDGGTVMLPKPLRNNLSPEEWKPLLASQLIYERRSNMRTFARWLVSVSFLLMWGFAALVLAGAYGDYGLALALSLLIPIAILDTWFFSHEWGTGRWGIPRSPTPRPVAHGNGLTLPGVGAMMVGRSAAARSISACKARPTSAALLSVT